MKTLFKIGVVIFLGLIALVYFSSKTEFAVFQDKVVVFSNDIRSFKHRPASYYQWGSQLEAEWQRIRSDIEAKPMTEGIVKQFDDLFATVMRDIKKDMEKAGGDVPQVLPQE